jgi:hypothetical protein
MVSRRLSVCTYWGLPPGHTSDIVPQGTTIDGIAIQLPGPLDDDTQQKILAATSAIALRASTSDPFLDNPHVSQSSDGEKTVGLIDFG